MKEERERERVKEEGGERERDDGEIVKTNMGCIEMGTFLLSFFFSLSVLAPTTTGR